MTRLRTAAVTDIGRRRRDNQDRYFDDDKLALYGVADGIGGLPGGADAAQETVNSVTASIRAVPAGGQPDLLSVTLAANASVAALGSRLHPDAGIGTTLTFGLIRARTLHLVHVGDSRCYRFRDGQLEPLTEDHSVANEARRMQAQGKTIQFAPEYASALTRCIGQQEDVKPEISEHPIEAGDRYLFVTDGVTRLVLDPEIEAALAAPFPPAEVVRRLVELAVTRGGPDNATAVLVDVEKP